MNYAELIAGTSLGTLVFFLEGFKCLSMRSLLASALPRAHPGVLYEAGVRVACMSRA